MAFVRSQDRPPTAPRADPGHQDRPSARWDSLDVLRGLALVLMICHHFAEWSGGRVEERFIGFDDLLVTDLAAPMFAVGVGAAALLVGLQIRSDPGRARRAAFRWGQVLLLGLVIDVAVGGGIDGGGVLPTLAVLGTVVTTAAALGVRRAWVWWGVALGCALVAVPVASGASAGFFGQLWAGPFSVVVYGVFAASGAALASHAGGGGERALPLLWTTATVLVAGLLGTWLAPALLAPDGLWPPARYPGDLAFTVWGLTATLVTWAVLRSVVPATTWLGAGLARAGRRTLLVFGSHYIVKLVLQHSGRLETLDTWRWGLAAWAAMAVACALAMAPARSPLPARASAAG